MARNGKDQTIKGAGLQGYIAKDPSPKRPVAKTRGDLIHARSTAITGTWADQKKNPGMYENAPKRAYPHSSKWATQAEAYGQRRNAGVTPLRNGKPMKDVKSTADKAKQPKK